MDEAFDVSLKSMLVILSKFDQQNFDLNFNSDYQSISMYKDQVHSFIFEVLIINVYFSNHPLTPPSPPRVGAPITQQSTP